MNKADRKSLQDKGDAEIRNKRVGFDPILKTDSLFERARKMGIATDLPGVNRSQRRRELKETMKEERNKPKVTVQASGRKFVGRKAA